MTREGLVPATSAALAGSVALASLEVIATVSVAADEVPVGVDRVDGHGERRAGGLRASACRSCRVARARAPRSRPGIRICSFANAPALTVVDGLVLAVFVPSVDVGRRDRQAARPSSASR